MPRLWIRIQTSTRLATSSKSKETITFICCQKTFCTFDHHQRHLRTVWKNKNKNILCTKPTYWKHNHLGKDNKRGQGSFVIDNVFNDDDDDEYDGNNYNDDDEDNHDANDDVW